jgi:hypothetical protein
MADASFGDSLDSFFTGTSDPGNDPNVGKASAVDQIQNSDGSATTVWSDGSTSTQAANNITQGAQNVQTPSFDLAGNIKSLLTGNSSLGVPGQLASLAGIASLLNGALGGNASNSAYKGYTGGIPTFQASRQQYATPQQQVGNYSANLPSNATPAQQAAAVNPNQFLNYIQNAGGNVTHAQIADQMNKYGITPQQAAAAVPGGDPNAAQQAYNAAMGPNAQLSPNYRPGQGGITYFSPMVYQPTSQLATAPTTTPTTTTTDTSSTAPAASTPTTTTTDTSSTAAASTPTISPSIQSAINASNVFNGSQLFGNRADFNTTAYLTAHPDVADSINSGQIMSAYQHYLMYGENGTKAQNPSYKFIGMANGGITQSYNTGGIASLGTYSDGGRMLKGPGDGVSDSIPATIGGHQKAALADGEFVIPARIVSEIGNGSSDAGARKLYAMMEKIQYARKKTVKNVAADTKAEQYLPT